MVSRALWVLSLLAAGCSPSTDWGTAGWATLATEADTFSAGAVLGMSLADLDGDGDLDLAVGLSSGGGHHVYENEGGVFTLVFDSGTADAHSVAWGDWNGDGYPELAIGTNAQNLVYANNGGVLDVVPAWTSTEASATRTVAWADFDSDGDLDLLAANASGQTDTIWRNTGGDLEPEAWANAWSSPSLTYAWGANWGDFDHDGDPDLAIGATGGTLVYLYTNDGGVLTAQGVAAGPTFDVRFGELDGDEDLELMAGRPGVENHIYDWNGLYWESIWSDGVYQATWAGPLGDVDLDGDLDAAFGNYGPTFSELNEVWLGDGDGALTSWWTSDPDHIGQATSAEFADLDGDGTLDLVFGELNDDEVYVNGIKGLAELWSGDSASDRGGHGVDLGDFDGDGDLDLGVVHGDQPVRVYRNEGDSFVPFWSSTEVDNGADLQWADWDGDGDLDLAVALQQAVPERIYENHRIHPTSAGEFFSLAWESPEQLWSHDLEWSDYDGDGDLDLAVSRGDAGSALALPAVVYANDGAGGMTLEWTSDHAQLGRTLSFVDVDCDGDEDLLTTGFQTELARLHLRDEAGLNTSAAWSGNLGDTLYDVAWADFDGDGDPDLLAGRQGGSVIFENTTDCSAPNPTVTLSTTPMWTAAEGTADYGVDVGDWNGDGELDVAFADRVGLVRVHEGVDGLPAEESAWSFGDPDDWSLDVAWGDLEGDGDLDLAVGHGVGSIVEPHSVWENHRNTAPRLPNNPTTAVIGALGERTGAGYLGPEVLLGPVLSVPVRVIDAEGDTAPVVRLEYAAIPGAPWQEATLLSPMDFLEGSPDGTEYDFDWDVQADGVQGDRVVLRVVVERQSPGFVAYPVQRGSRGSSPVQVRLYPECFPLDADGDGAGCGAATDCDDGDANNYVGNVEVCDGQDNDCGGDVDEGFDDSDSDGVADCVDPDDDNDGSDDGDDCAPLDGAVFPGATELCDAIDQDCDGSLVDDFGDVDLDEDPDCTDPDIDGDGFDNGDDCAPDDADIFLGQTEVVDDGIDQDCNNADAISCFEDLDDDGVGSSVVVVEVADEDCDDDPGQAGVSGDCDDGDGGVYEGAPELCDGVDNNCDGSVPADETDDDGDGADECGDGDCDDADALNAPGFAEVCDGQDNDCDAGTAELVDGDGDGVTICADDCDDADPARWPGAEEICDGQDNDCDDVTDELVDADGDGVHACGGDCDEGDAAVFPGAEEACDGLDTDCDGSVPGDEVADEDGDGAVACEDCDDADGGNRPGGVEVCDEADNDCDGDVDEGLDADGDGATPCGGDCDDGAADVGPHNLLETDGGERDRVCADGRDGDCDGVADADEPECDEDLPVPVPAPGFSVSCGDRAGTGGWLLGLFLLLRRRAPGCRVRPGPQGQGAT